jgi:tRNA 5-methylaminomethyl-2-thiouridine biosynthesis bifunctional protein
MVTGQDRATPTPARPWAGRHCWTVLHIAGRQGVAAFLQRWAQWREDPQRPGLLHFVLVTSDAHEVLAGIEGAAAQEAWRDAAALLRAACYGLTPGIHRLAFAQHRVLLTLGLGERNAVLRDLQLRADHVVWTKDQGEPAAAHEMRNCVKSLARLCGFGSTLSVQATDGGAGPGVPLDPYVPTLAQCGFVPLAPAGGQDDGQSLWRFAPRWRHMEGRAAATPSQPHRMAHWADPTAGASPPRCCVVIGAGLAGSSVASSLARRDWSVLVLDAAATPAAGASGLPVGLLTPHFSADDNLYSRLTRAGARMTWQAAERLTQQHVDWELTGTLEIGALPALRRAASARERESARSAAAMLDWDQPASAEQMASAGVAAGQSARWHPHAGWIKPGALVSAFLQEPGVTFRANTHVTRLVPKGGQWEILDAADEVLAIADLVIVAAGPNSQGLLDGRLVLTPVAGMVSWGEGILSGPPFPVNGNGSFIPNVPGTDGCVWYLGASYQREPMAEPDERQGHRGNLARLANMLPQAAELLAPRLASGQVQAWSGTRATTRDHLPLAGPIDAQAGPGLWVCTGMGSRGLSFAVLCAELVAAQLCGEAWPVGRKMAAALAPNRKNAQPQIDNASILILKRSKRRTIL